MIGWLGVDGFDWLFFLSCPFILIPSEGMY